MRALSGQRPDSGEILLNGEDLYADQNIGCKRLGMCRSITSLHDHLTLSKALIYIGRLRLPNLSILEIEDRVDKLLEEFDFHHDDKRRKIGIGE